MPLVVAGLIAWRWLMSATIKIACHPAILTRIVSGMRFNSSGDRRRRSEFAWPDDASDDARELFEPRPPLRKIVVLVDHEILVDDSSPWSKEALLTGLLTHPYVQVVRYADDGPPPSAARITSPWGGEHVPGWAVLHQRHEDGEVRGFITGDEQSVSGHAIYGNSALIARNDRNHPAYSSLAPDEALKRREADVLGARVAEEISADLYITRRDYLSGEAKYKAKNVLLCTPEEALPLLGLYLRRQGVFIYFRGVDGKFQYRCSRRLYFFTGALELLPSMWRWSTAFGQYALAANDDTLPALSSSLVQRVERALQSRDELFAALNMHGNRDSTDDALRSLDTALIFLMGALDASARAAHRVLGISVTPRNAGWQSRNWLERVAVTAPKLAAIFDEGSEAQHLLEILRKFRNSVHGEALSPLTVKEGSDPERILVSLPREDLQAILNSMDALGGRDAWGVESHWDNHMHAGPGTLLGETLERVVSVLNRIMQETPVESLQGVHVTPAQCMPPNDPSGRYSDMKREGIRWQLGF
ncbi:hypothetical protein [Streptomyces sp. WM6386]|uniref:hypothetical protein n=1 Tax=Streptomyces sp. WM6386 TaxID=1415558 RepID=UPI00131EBBBC|nr:hypothetical protein [Streptomyces sp. WM6386]